MSNPKPLATRHSPLAPPFASLILLALLVLAGCQQFQTPPLEDFQSFLRPVETSARSVTLDIFQLRFPEDDRSLVEDLWQQVDEQRLPADLRRKLIRNGFRVGVLGGALPDSLARALDLQSEIPEASSARLLTGQSAQPRVTRRVLQLGCEEQATIQASELRQRIDPLISDESGLHCKTLTQAEAAYALHAELTDGQRVVLRLTPEIHHGELRNRYTGGDQGIFLMTPSREHKVFSDLRIRAELAPGELLLVGCLAHAPGSLGHVFQTVRRQGQLEHKLVLVRLLQVPASEILAQQ